MSRFPRSLVTVYAANGLNGVVSVVAIPIAVKLLGISGYGLLSIYVLMAAYILLADLGIGKNLLRLLAESPDPEAKERHIRVAAGLYAVLVLVWLALIPVLLLVVPRYLFPVPQAYVTGLRWMVVLSVVEFALGVPSSLMQTACVAAQRFDAYSGYTVISGLVRNGAIICGAFAFRSPVEVAAVLAARKLIDFAVAARILGGLPPAAWLPSFDLRSFRAMLGQSLTLSASQILTSTLMSAGSFLVNAAFGLFGLGVYRAAFDLAGKIAVVSNGVTLVLFPKAARYFAKGSVHGAGAVFAPLIRASAAMYSCFAAAMVLAAPYVLPAMGLKDGSTLRLFQLLVIALSLNAHSVISNELIQASGRYAQSICYSGSALVTLGALFFGAWGQGVMAIGWAWIGAALVSATVADALLLRFCGAGRWEHASVVLIKLTAAAACLCLAWPRFSEAANPAVALLGMVIMAAVATVAAAGVLPLARAWRGGQTAAPLPRDPVVWA